MLLLVSRCGRPALNPPAPYPFSTASRSSVMKNITSRKGEAKDGEHDYSRKWPWNTHHNHLNNRKGTNSPKTSHINLSAENVLRRITASRYCTPHLVFSSGSRRNWTLFAPLVYANNSQFTQNPAHLDYQVKGTELRRQYSTWLSGVKTSLWSLVEQRLMYCSGSN